MSVLNTKPNLADPDDVYARLIDAHEGLTDDESMALNARIILLLANQIGDTDTVIAAIDAAAARDDK